LSALIEKRSLAEMDNLNEVADRVITSVREVIWPDTPENRELEELLAEHADALRRGDRRTRTYFERLPEEGDELALLLPLAERVSDAMQPVVAAADFQARLMGELMQKAYARPACAQPAPSLWREKRTEIIIGATVGSVLSAVGVAYFIYSRLPNHDRQAAG
jgi:hypothetical protein